MSQNEPLHEDKGSWNPCLAGALNGLAGIFSVWLTGKYFNTSTTFACTSGMLKHLSGPERVAQLCCYIKNAPHIDWQWMFVAGIFLWSMAAALTSGSFKLQAVPDMWAKSFDKKSV